MPKYYCDYCDTFLTHDSPSVRKTHNGGRKHKENVRMYYQNWMEQQAQKLVDATTKAFTQHRALNNPPGMPGAGIPMPNRPPMMPPMGANMRGNKNYPYAALPQQIMRPGMTMSMPPMPHSGAPIPGMIPPRIPLPPRQ